MVRIIGLKSTVRLQLPDTQHCSINVTSLL